MKLTLKPVFSLKLFYSLITGLLLTLAFPGWGLDWLAWLALIPLLKALQNSPPGQAFRLGFFSGLSHYLTLMYWIYNVISYYGGLNPMTSIAVLLLLCCYLSLYPALFAFFFSKFQARPWIAFWSAVLWSSLEYGRAKLLTGLPWGLLGYSQSNHTLLIQLSDLTGVFGISFLLVWSNVLIFTILLKRELFKKCYLKWETALFLSAFVFTLGYGYLSLDKEGKARRPFKAAVIQGNIDQSIKWDPAYQHDTIQIYRTLTQSTCAFGPDLIVWPETAVPLFFQDQNKLTDQIRSVPRECGADFIFGSPAYQKKQNQAYHYFNRAYHLNPEGNLADHYDKIHLVPFGEYVPLKKWLFFVERLVAAAGDFAAGESLKPLDLIRQKVAVLICFETIFPEIARNQVRQGADLIIILTNDAWFGRTSAPYQHFSMAVFRAVENHRPVIRAANTGISGFINSQGKILKQGGLFTPEALFQEIDLGPQTQTMYTRYGDWFAGILILAGFFYLLFILWYDKSVKHER